MLDRRLALRRRRGCDALGSGTTAVGLPASRKAATYSTVSNRRGGHSTSDAGLAGLGVLWIPPVGAWIKGQMEGVGGMADHLDAPGLTSPGGDARLDITDVYAFQKPGDAAKSVLIMNVNPLAPTLAAEFHPGAVYRINVDTNGDAVAEITFSAVFSDVEGGVQRANVHG